MDIEIVKQKETPLLSRKRVTAKITAEAATPSRLKIRDELAKKLKVDPSLVIIKHLYSQFGDKTVKIIANLYEKRELLEKFEHKKLVAKHQEKQEGTTEAKETKAEAKPAAT